tara:strand:+ start:36 stop:1388 length:1353 start_codon:yes stop_codon:yes gene_type:complete
MKNNILSEVNRVREIMGLNLLNEQIDVDDEIIVEPETESPYIKWEPNDGPAFYTLKELKDKHITMRVGGYRYIGPFEPEGYVTLFTDKEEIEGEDFSLSVPVTPVIGGNMDIPFIEIDNRKSKPGGPGGQDGRFYNLSEGARFIGPQKEQWNFQNSEEIYSNIGEELRNARINQTKGQYRFLMYGQNTGNKLGISVTTIQLKDIDELIAMGKTEGQTKGKKGYLSKINYIPQKGGQAWHLMGDVSIMPTAGIIGMGGDIPDVPDVITQGFDFRADNPFEFDKAGITDEAKEVMSAKMLGLFELKKGEGDKLQQYIDKYLKGKEVIINAYSSIDADPEEIGGGEYVGPKNCAKRVNGQPTIKRKDYNLCLSQARAEAVADYLKLEYPEIFGEVIFNPIGHGEDNESGKGVFAPYGSAEQKEHAANNREATKTDRRFQFSLPGATFKDNVIQ